MSEETEHVMALSHLSRARGLAQALTDIRSPPPMEGMVKIGHELEALIHQAMREIWPNVVFGVKCGHPGPHRLGCELQKPHVGSHVGHGLRWENDASAG